MPIFELKKVPYQSAETEDHHVDGSGRGTWCSRNIQPCICRFEEATYPLRGTQKISLRVERKYRSLHSLVATKIGEGNGVRRARGWSALWLLREVQRNSCSRMDNYSSSLQTDVED